MGLVNEVWLTVALTPGKENRKLRRTTEWLGLWLGLGCLNKQVFQIACDKLNTKSNIDLFASRINYQIKPYMSYSPDAEAIAVNAFHQ